MDELKACHAASIGKMIEAAEIQLNNLAEEWRDALKRAQDGGTYDKNSGLWKYQDQSRVDRASYAMEAYRNAATIVADLGQAIDNMSRAEPENKPLTVEYMVNDKRPVWIEWLNWQTHECTGKGNYGIPNQVNTGVLASSRTLMLYRDYGKTWLAYARNPEQEENKSGS